MALHESDAERAQAAIQRARQSAAALDRKIARLRADVTLLGWIVTVETAVIIALAFKVWL